MPSKKSKSKKRSSKASKGQLKQDTPQESNHDILKPKADGSQVSDTFDDLVDKALGADAVLSNTITPGGSETAQPARNSSYRLVQPVAPESFSLKPMEGASKQSQVRALLEILQPSPDRNSGRHTSDTPSHPFWNNSRAPMILEDQEMVIPWEIIQDLRLNVKFPNEASPRMISIRNIKGSLDYNDGVERLKKLAKIATSVGCIGPQEEAQSDAGRLTTQTSQSSASAQMPVEAHPHVPMRSNIEAGIDPSWRSTYGPEALAEWARHLFDTGIHSDTSVQLVSYVGAFPPTTFYLHSHMIARSAVLRAHIMHQPNGVLTISAFAWFGGLEVFASVLRHLYGGPYLQPSEADALAHQQSQQFGYAWPESSSSEKVLHVYLTYAACGAALGLLFLVRHGLDMASLQLDWKNLELAVKFCCSSNEFALDSDSQCPLEDYFVSLTQMELFTRTHEYLHGRPVPLNQAIDPSQMVAFRTTLEPTLLNEVIQYLYRNFPSPFNLNTEVYAKVMPDRLPSSGHGGRVARYQCDNPRLKNLQLGELSSMPESQSLNAFCNDRVSVLMLTMPFVWLRKLLEWLRDSESITQDQAEAVVAERERRRADALFELEKTPLEPKHGQYLSLYSRECIVYDGQGCTGPNGETATAKWVLAAKLEEPEMGKCAGTERQSDHIVAESLEESLAFGMR